MKKRRASAIPPARPDRARGFYALIGAGVLLSACAGSQERVSAPAVQAASPIIPGSLPLRRTIPCAARSIIVANMEQEGGRQVAIGLDIDGTLMELWRAPDGRFVVLSTFPGAEKLSCIRIRGGALELSTSDPGRDG